MLLSQRTCPTASSAGLSLYHQCSTCLSRCTCTYQQSVLSHADKALPTQAHSSMQIIFVQYSNCFPKHRQNINAAIVVMPKKSARRCYCRVSVEHVPANEVCQLSPGGGFVGCYPAQFLLCSCFQALLPDFHIRRLTFNHSNICIMLKPLHVCKDTQSSYLLLHEL